MSKLAVTIDNRTFQVEADLSRAAEAELLVLVEGQPVRVRLPDPEAPVEQMEWVVVDDRPYEIVLDRDLNWIRSHSRTHRLEIRDLETPARVTSGHDGRIKAPIPGQITQVLIGEGQQVETGQPLLMLEAMKMENEIRATRSGTVSSLHVTPGQNVSLHEVLVEIT